MEREEKMHCKIHNFQSITGKDAVEHAKLHNNIQELLDGARRKILLPRRYKNHSKNRRRHNKKYYQEIIDLLT